MTAATVDDEPVRADGAVLAATWPRTVELGTAMLEASPLNEPPTGAGKRPPKDAHGDGDGSGRGRSESASSSPPSGNSGARTNGSNERWRKPKHVRALAAQINEVATRVLNGEIDMEQARVYSGLTRTLAQTISAETTRARFAQEAPDLSLEDPS